MRNSIFVKNILQKTFNTILLLHLRLLVGITTPIRCLTFVETSNGRIHSSDIICQLRQLLYRAKEAFLDPRATRTITTHVGLLLDNVYSHIHNT